MSSRASALQSGERFAIPAEGAQPLMGWRVLHLPQVRNVEGAAVAFMKKSVFPGSELRLGIAHDSDLDDIEHFNMDCLGTVWQSFWVIMVAIKLELDARFAI